MAEDFLVREIREEGIKNAADRLVEDMAKIFGMMRELESGLCREVVERNGFAYDLCYQEDRQKRIAALSHFLRQASHADHGLLTEVRDAGYAINNKRAEFEAFLEVATGLLSSMHEKWTVSLDAKSAADARIAELTERLKEHALHNAEVRETVWNMTGGKCFYCEVELIRCVGGEQDRLRCFHIDHIVPKVSGGPDHISNYVPACERCNISKNAKSFVEFLAWRKAQQAPPQLTVIEGGAVA